MMGDSDATPLPERIVFERQVAAVLAHVNKEFLRNTKLDSSDAARLAADELVLRLEAHIWANPLGRMYVSYPASPWEHFRATYFHRNRLGRWLIRRKPIRFHWEVRSALASFPEAHMALPPKLGRRVMILRDDVPNYTAS